MVGEAEVKSQDALDRYVSAVGEKEGRENVTSLRVSVSRYLRFIVPVLLPEVLIGTGYVFMMAYLYPCELIAKQST